MKHLKQVTKWTYIGLAIASIAVLSINHASAECAVPDLQAAQAHHDAGSRISCCGIVFGPQAAAAAGIRHAEGKHPICNFPDPAHQVAKCLGEQNAAYPDALAHAGELAAMPSTDPENPESCQSRCADCDQAGQCGDGKDGQPNTGCGEFQCWHNCQTGKHPVCCHGCEH